MIRKVRIVLVTLLKRIIHIRGLKLHGFQDLRVDTELVIKKAGKMELGKRTSAFRRVTLAANGGFLRIGDNVFFNRNCIVAALDRIDIGNRCIFGPNVVIYDHDHRFNHEGIVHGEYNTKPVVIEDDCWIGANVTILRGTHIGKGCVIGAGSVVKGTIPAHSIVKSNRELIVEELRTV